MTTVAIWLGAGAFGALGALGRFQLDTAVSRRWPSDFPFGTLTVNLLGAFALGVLVGASLASELLLVFGTGFLGAFTTFSTWMFESQRLGEDGEWRLVWLNLAAPMAAGLAAAGAGWLLGAVIP